MRRVLLLVSLLLIGCSDDSNPQPIPDTTAPQLTVVSPASGATSVLPSVVIQASFDEALDATSVTNMAVTLNGPGGTPVAGTVTYANQVISITPAAALAESTIYDVALGNGITDTAGNAFAGFSWSFTTADLTPPTIAQVAPQVDATNVASTTQYVIAQFDETLDGATLTATSFSLVDGSGSAVPGTVFYANPNAVFQPTAGLGYGVTYTATLTTAIQDPAGNALATDYSWSFTIEPDVPPQVVSTQPTDGLKGYQTAGGVSVNFSENIDPASVTAVTFSVTDGSGAPVAGTLSVSGSNVTFSADLSYSYNETFTVSLSTGITDSSGGLPLPAPYQFTFTTRPAPVQYVTTIQTVKQFANVSGIATGDLDSDGNLDLILTNPELPVLLGSGSGSFASATFNTGLGGSNEVALGLFDADANLDAVVNQQATDAITVYAGNGDGTFAAGTDYPVGNYPVDVHVDDLNADNRPDIVVANGFSTGNSLSVLYGNGDGTFAAATTLTVGSFPVATATADLNGDNFVDIVSANSSDDTVSVLLGKVGGGFDPAVAYAVGGSPFDVAIADYDSDGSLDLLVPNVNGQNLSFLAGNGDGTFTAAQTIDHKLNGGDSRPPRAVVAADLNLDGRMDAAIANTSPNGSVPGVITVLLGYGDGTFFTPLEYVSGSGSEHVISADFNKDGKPDLATSDLYGGSVTLLISQ